ncbi:hypothetical protein DPEC_G00287550 [Dallia pectoralis]|uniref:Uncharacterized protein n=1 Tax=Dallia pectoralis TaxID=75939 RepID=A0ACC2FK62_DALPE|nr:hypothetical protein DPEC_G00287550 [Dallia pectoralis]
MGLKSSISWTYFRLRSHSADNSESQIETVSDQPGGGCGRVSADRCRIEEVQTRAAAHTVECSRTAGEEL